LLTFIVPIRHQATTANWPGIKARLEVTLRSLCAQSSPEWNAVIVANRGADLPNIPKRVSIVWVDFAANKLPDKTKPIEQLYQAIRLDKGRRLLAGMMESRPTGHVMTVDYDDMVSRRLAGFVSENPTGNGWYCNSGYLFSGGRLLYSYPSEFFEFCGTSHIIRADLLHLPERFEDATDEYVCRTIGSHKFIKKDLEEAGTPLACLPFPGAVYRIGHPDTASNSSSLLSHVLKRYHLRTPILLLRKILRFRFLNGARAREFFGGVAGDSVMP
jgi:hypothetical protein